MSISNALIILATLLGPVLAVQAQKWLERSRNERDRKLQVFKTLMATRADTVSADHVKALNMIDLEFQDQASVKVRAAWKNYLDHLSSFPKEEQPRQPVWIEKRVDLLATLLLEMGNSLGYSFDEVHVKKGIYAPEAHAQLENEQMLLRRGLIHLVYGDSSLKMNIESFPVGEEDVQRHDKFQRMITEIAEGKRILKVEYVEPRNTPPSA